MATFPEYRRRAIQPLIGVAMVVFYLMVFLPLSKQADALDKPLEKDWAALTRSLGRTNAMTLDFRQISAQLDETRRSIAALSAAEQKTIARLQPGATLRAHLSAPFRLVDYQNELSQHSDEATQAAALRQIQIAPAVFDGFPQHRTDIKEPSLLWGALDMAETAVDTAIACGVTAIHSLDVTVNFTNSPSSVPPEPVSPWVEVPFTMEFSATTPAAMKVLESLPLRTEEVKAAGLPQINREKPVLFIQRLVMKRQSPDKPDDLRVWIKAAGFILRE